VQRTRERLGVAAKACPVVITERLQDAIKQSQDDDKERVVCHHWLRRPRPILRAPLLTLFPCVRPRNCLHCACFSSVPSPDQRLSVVQPRLHQQEVACLRSLAGHRPKIPSCAVQAGGAGVAGAASNAGWALSWMQQLDDHVARVWDDDAAQRLNFPWWSRTDESFASSNMQFCYCCIRVDGRVTRPSTLIIRVFNAVRVQTEPRVRSRLPCNHFLLLRRHARCMPINLHGPAWHANAR
jgi:hypothetical protein